MLSMFKGGHDEFAQVRLHRLKDTRSACCDIWVKSRLVEIKPQSTTC